MPNSAQAPLKLIDIQSMLSNGYRAGANMLPPSLAFLANGGNPSGIPQAQTDPNQPGFVNPRHLPFNDIPPQLRDQRQQLAAQVPQSNPFSLAGAMEQLQAQANTPR